MMFVGYAMPWVLGDIIYHLGESRGTLLRAKLAMDNPMSMVVDGLLIRQISEQISD